MTYFPNFGYILNLGEGQNSVPPPVRIWTLNTPLTIPLLMHLMLALLFFFSFFIAFTTWYPHQVTLYWVPFMVNPKNPNPNPNTCIIAKLYMRPNVHFCERDSAIRIRIWIFHKFHKRVHNNKRRIFCFNISWNIFLFGFGFGFFFSDGAYGPGPGC